MSVLTLTTNVTRSLYYGVQTLSLCSSYGNYGSELVLGRLRAYYSLNFDRFASIFSSRLLLRISSAICSGRDIGST